MFLVYSKIVVVVSDSVVLCVAVEGGGEVEQTPDTHFFTASS